jgi:N-acetylneuraminic acid mutarotase
VTGDEDGPGPRASHTLALVDGKLFVWGGWREDADVWVYDPDADAWTEIPNTDGPLGRDAQVTGVADDGFYIFGGDPYDEDVPDFTNDLWHFDAVTEAWTELQPWTDSDLGQ